jgi:carbon storage regulator
MLIITRDPGQALIINRNIIIRVLDVQRRQVRFGIEAPRSIEVHRKEILDRILMEELLAAGDAIRQE